MSGQHLSAFIETAYQSKFWFRLFVFFPLLLALKNGCQQLVFPNILNFWLPTLTYDEKELLLVDRHADPVVCLLYFSTFDDSHEELSLFGRHADEILRLKPDFLNLFSPKIKAAHTSIN